MVISDCIVLHLLMLWSILYFNTGSESFCEAMQEQMEEEEPNDVIPCAGPEEKHKGSSKEVNCIMEDSGLGTAGEDNDCLGKRNADECTKESVNGEPETQIRAKRKRKKVV